MSRCTAEVQVHAEYSARPPYAASKTPRTTQTRPRALPFFALGGGQGVAGPLPADGFPLFLYDLTNVGWADHAATTDASTTCLPASLYSVLLNQAC